MGRAGWGGGLGKGGGRGITERPDTPLSPPDPCTHPTVLPLVWGRLLEPMLRRSNMSGEGGLFSTEEI